MINKPGLAGIPRQNLKSRLKEAGFPVWRADQIYDELFNRRTRSIDEMSLIPKKLRQFLNKSVIFPSAVLAEKKISSDASIKAVVNLMDGSSAEAVWLPADSRHTVCISTQSGCAMNCSFCYTGSMGLDRSLEAAEIIEQIMLLQDISGQKANRVLFMGMGEPFATGQALFDSLSVIVDQKGMGIGQSKIIVSTVGMANGITRLGKEFPGVGIALSVGSAIERKREKIIPAQKTHPLERALKAIESLPSHRRRLTLEYTLINEVNDSPADITALIRAAERINARVNVISFNPWPKSEYSEPSEEKLQSFVSRIEREGIICTIRKPRGRDISAACGMLYRRMKENK